MTEPILRTLEPVEVATEGPAELKIPCEVYSRIVGYLRPLQNWHQGKQQEFSERRTFQIPPEVLSPEQ